MSTVSLTKAEYYELKAAALAVDSLELEAVKVAQDYARKLGEAREKSAQLFLTLAKAHDFDPKLAYRWDDAATSLVSE